MIRSVKRIQAWLSLNLVSARQFGDAVGETMINSLQRLQNRATRIVANNP